MYGDGETAGGASLEAAVAGFTELQQAGKIRHWGVSNFDAADMEDLFAVPGSRQVATNQVLYHLGERGPEWDLLPWLRAHDIPLMAYSPLGQGDLLPHPGLVQFTARHGMTPAQAALAWVLGHKDAIAIPKSSTPERLEENLTAADVELNAEQHAEFNELFTPPNGHAPLQVI